MMYAFQSESTRVQEQELIPGQFDQTSCDVLMCCEKSLQVSLFVRAELTEPPILARLIALLLAVHDVEEYPTIVVTFGIVVEFAK